jgi:hypothetical protein
MAKRDLTMLTEIPSKFSRAHRTGKSAEIWTAFSRYAEVSQLCPEIGGYVIGMDVSNHHAGVGKNTC